MFILLASPHLLEIFPFILNESLLDEHETGEFCPVMHSWQGNTFSVCLEPYLFCIKSGQRSHPSRHCLWSLIVNPDWSYPRDLTAPTWIHAESLWVPISYMCSSLLGIAPGWTECVGATFAFWARSQMTLNKLRRWVNGPQFWGRTLFLLFLWCILIPLFLWEG